MRGHKNPATSQGIESPVRYVVEYFVRHGGESAKDDREGWMVAIVCLHLQGMNKRQTRFGLYSASGKLADYTGAMLATATTIRRQPLGLTFSFHNHNFLETFIRMSSSNPYDNDAHAIDEDDLIDPDDGNITTCSSIRYETNTCADLADLDDPLQQPSSDRAPLTGNIQRDGALDQRYLTSTIPGEDRRAPHNTLDESVWATLSRDLKAVWEKMRLVLWPNHLLGGILTRSGGPVAAAERGEGGLAGGVRNMLGRWPDADVVLQQGMSEGLRDWDLWYVSRNPVWCTWLC